MKIFFCTNSDSPLAENNSVVLASVKLALLSLSVVEESFSPASADIILIQEKNSFKNFRYITHLLNDPLLSRYYHKTFTINDDDCATGILRGLYTSLPKSRFNTSLYAAVPFFTYPNELVFSQSQSVGEPQYLAGWRGNIKSNSIRRKLLQYWQGEPNFLLQTTTSWLNHLSTEKQDYIDLITNAKFSLCPAGWAAVSFRIYESMALGRCPVIIADEFVSPLGPDWTKFALFLPEREIGNLEAFLAQWEPQYQHLGQQARAAWFTYFSPEVLAKYYAQSLVTLFNRQSATSLATERQRWATWQFYWSNNWTLPQRLWNKAKGLIRNH
ncbi:MAG: hypothetical protein EOO61_15005 [Hymenobacter sp.]|nr:MAG: hypothetical protein EOO61_15005 [Hymenobacter sp.]